MSLNWKEIALILQETDLSGSKIQSVIQNNFHSLTWEMYSKERGRFLYYTEVGTDTSRLHILSSGKKIQKTKKLQRFIQFARKNIEGSVITDVEQLPYDRCVIWNLTNHDRKLKIFIRLYSGSGANIIVTDENNTILDLLLRRPNRDETSGQTLKLETRTQEGMIFTVREHEGTLSSYIEKTCSDIQTDDIYNSLVKQVEARKNQELDKIADSILSAEVTISKNKDFETIKINAQLLSANIHLLKQGMPFVKLTDWTTDKEVVLTLDKSLSPSENIQNYYNKYRKAKGAYQNAIKESERLKTEYKTKEEQFTKALTQTDNRENDIERLKAILEKVTTVVQEHNGPGVYCTSGGFDIIAGRNAKENDELLRHYAKGNDMWLHTRDFPGGYVFIKYKKNKTIPLDVLLDAANLAVLYSKGKNDSQVDLYYTQVCHLRRAKNSKTGLVLPTMEKNLTIKPDRERITRLLNGKEKELN